MKNFIYIFFTIIFFFSCKNDDDSIVKTSGTILSSITIDTGSGNERVENFVYNPNGTLRSVETELFARKNECDYANNQLQIIRVLGNDDALIRKDSFSYNEAERINKVFRFSNNGNDSLEVRWTYEFFYNEENQVNKMITSLTNEIIHSDSFYWSNNNIVQIDIFDKMENLAHIYLYEYDDKQNFKKDLPYYSLDPLSFSANNVTQYTAMDFTGILDLVCNPCNHSYKYNLDDFPVEIDYGWDWKYRISYE